jgi:molybdopterin molybdotransferase
MLTVHEADELLRRHTCAFPAVSVPLVEAEGRILREDIVADRDHPPFDRVAMDGIAIAAAAREAGLDRFRVQGIQRAGEAPHTLTDPEACLEVMTGAVLPAGCDAVIRYEDLAIADGTAAFKEPLRLEPKHNVHQRGVDRKAGEPILGAGVRIRSPHIAALASVGKAMVQVAAIPRIVVLSTGDELVELGEPVLPHQIRRSNAYAIRAALLERGFTNVGLVHAPDVQGTLREILAEAIAEADMVLLSGGVSAGKFDLVPSVLSELGVRNVFHKLAQKPGKPIWFGLTTDDKPVYGLPGNPVSVLVCLYRYVLPYLARASGNTAPAARLVSIAQRPQAKNGFTLFMPVRIDGLVARKVPSNGSGDFLSLLDSDGFVEISPDADSLTVPFYSWSVS